MKSMVLLFTGGINPRSTQSLNQCLSRAANEGVEEVQLWINSSGGNSRLAFGLYNLIRAMPFTTITHNLHEVGSAAITLFLAGDVRFAHKDASFFFHGLSWNYEQKTSLLREQMAENASRFEQDHARYLTIVGECTAYSSKELEGMLRDHRIVKATEAKRKKLITGVRPPVIPKDAHVITVDAAQSASRG